MALSRVLRMSPTPAKKKIAPSTPYNTICLILRTLAPSLIKFAPARMSPTIPARVRMIPSVLFSILMHFGVCRQRMCPWAGKQEMIFYGRIFRLTIASFAMFQLLFCLLLRSMALPLNSQIVYKPDCLKRVF